MSANILVDSITNRRVWQPAKAKLTDADKNEIVKIVIKELGKAGIEYAADQIMSKVTKYIGKISQVPGMGLLLKLSTSDAINKIVKFVAEQIISENSAEKTGASASAQAKLVDPQKIYPEKTYLAQPPAMTILLKSTLTPTEISPPPGIIGKRIISPEKGINLAVAEITVYSLEGLAEKDYEANGYLIKSKFINPDGTLAEKTFLLMSSGNLYHLRKTSDGKEIYAELKYNSSKNFWLAAMSKELAPLIADKETKIAAEAQFAYNYLPGTKTIKPKSKLESLKQEVKILNKISDQIKSAKTG